VPLFQILAITGVPGARGFRVTGWLIRFSQFWQSSLIRVHPRKIRSKVFGFPITAVPLIPLCVPLSFAVKAFAFDQRPSAEICGEWA
jgi:hypothetical protein